MRKSTFSEHQIIGALKRAAQGVAVKDICRERGVSWSTMPAGPLGPVSDGPAGFLV